MIDRRGGKGQAMRQLGEENHHPPAREGDTAWLAAEAGLSGGEGGGVRQGFPVALTRTVERDIDLVDGVFVVVMRYLGSWASASKRRPPR